jgi:hypothetical protein
VEELEQDWQFTGTWRGRNKTGSVLGCEGVG